MLVQTTCYSTKVGGSVMSNIMTAILVGLTTAFIVFLFEFLKIDSFIIKIVILFITIFVVLKLSRWSKSETMTENN